MFRLMKKRSMLHPPGVCKNGKAVGVQLPRKPRRKSGNAKWGDGSGMSATKPDLAQPKETLGGAVWGALQKWDRAIRDAEERRDFTSRRRRQVRRRNCFKQMVTGRTLEKKEQLITGIQRERGKRKKHFRRLRIRSIPTEFCGAGPPHNFRRKPGNKKKRDTRLQGEKQVQIHPMFFREVSLKSQ